MTLDFVNRISSELKLQRKDMIEKDLLLHQILTDLSNNKFFSKNFLFKGGTCLIKNYLGYFRFSEDIDFTWKDQAQFSEKSGKEISKDLSKTIDETGSVFEAIAAKRGLDFKCIKSDINYVELGGSNKMCTLKIWYDSEVLKRKTFIKVQINFVESLCLKPGKGKLTSLLTGKHEELNVLFPEYLEYSTAAPFDVYDIKEILSEKIRALLTRKGIKARDFLDVFFIYQKFSIKPSDVEDCVIKKMNHTLRLYDKYKDNLQAKKKLLEENAIFTWGEERGLLISELNEKEFDKFVSELTVYLKELVKKL
ncbi:MAG: nucleotidyl transferase AbiEii/AbiGii toxin family protein [Nitrosotalea sp.]